jgi:hypothetical protein
MKGGEKMLRSPAAIDRAHIEVAVESALSDVPTKIRELSKLAGDAVIVDGARDGRTVRLALERLERDGRARRVPYKGWVKP